MPKVPTEAMPLPKKKYHYSDTPKTRLKKTLIMAAMWECQVVYTYRGYLLHLLVDKKTLCGIDDIQVRKSQHEWKSEFIEQCKRCAHTYKLIQEYLNDCS